jgi:hypothetical protein
MQDIKAGDGFQSLGILTDMSTGLKMLLKKWIGDEGTICVAKDRDHDRPL